MTRLLWLVAALSLPNAAAVTPTGVVSLSVPGGSPQFADLLCSPSSVAGWGVTLPEQYNSRWKHVYSLVHQDPTNRFGCEPYEIPMPSDASLATTTTHTSHHSGHLQSSGMNMAVTPRNLTTVVMVDRGNCSFLQKAMAAESAGARGIVIRGSKEAIYETIRDHKAHSNETAELEQSVLPPFEYDCGRGEAYVSELAIPEWKTDSAACSKNPLCASGMCVLTGKTGVTAGHLEHQLCCMWDTYLVIGGGNRSQSANVSIPVVYTTARDSQLLDRALTNYPSLLMRTFRRDIPLIDIASILLWALGVTTAIGAAYYSAGRERRASRRRRQQHEDAEHGEGHDGVKQHDHRRHRRHSSASSDHQVEETWELDTRHAVGFILFAGVFLTILFYVKAGVTVLVPVLFAVAGAAALTQVVMAPALHAFVPAIASRQFVLPFPLSFLVDEPIPMAELAGLVPSATLAVGWYLHRRTWWPVQDVMGVVLCFIFLRTVQLPNLKVASVLLSLAFCYDIFFVFISPLVFGRSVMEDVATGGPAAYTRHNYPGIDYCERYPSEIAACVEPDPMPMLLILPRILTWLKGESMLGLGDIILPGMVLSFALRFDYAPKTVGGANYFRIASIGYGVGLSMANAAVTLMEMGQPALMYLVPTTLGTLIVASRQHGSDFQAMWTGAGLDDDESDDEYIVGDDDVADAAAIDVETQSTSGHNDSRGEQSGLLTGSRAPNAHQATRSVNESGHDSAPLLGHSAVDH